MRIELADGQWAELRDALTYAQAREVRRAKLAADVDPVALADFDLALARAYVIEWYVVGSDGPLPFAQVEIAPDAVVQTVARAALKLWNSAASPKGGTSSSTLRAVAG